MGFWYSPYTSWKRRNASIRFSSFEIECRKWRRSCSYKWATLMIVKGSRRVYTEPEGIVNVPFVVKHFKLNGQCPARTVGYCNRCPMRPNSYETRESWKRAHRAVAKFLAAMGVTWMIDVTVMQHPLEVLDPPPQFRTLHITSNVPCSLCRLTRPEGLQGGL